MVAAASSLSPVSTVDAYPQSLQCLIQTLKQGTAFTPQRVSMVLKNAQVSADDLFPWADFKHSPTDSYGRQLLYHGGNFEIMVMTWLPGDFSAIHDHGSTQWGAVQCFGHADHYIYRFCDHKLRDYATAHYTPGMIRAVNHDLIHQMGNTGDEPFLSLHVYGSPTAQPDITGNARVFNLFS
ncbi:MAG: cysteine dioxygenase family protein, partial [Cyanobacteria bacterium P01_H01_bin.15]